MKKTDDETLIKAMEILSRDIQSDDGIANEVVREAAQRLRELKSQRDILLDLARDSKGFIDSYAAYDYNFVWRDNWLKNFEKVTLEAL